jgi:hypothetical protein
MPKPIKWEKWGETAIRAHGYSISRCISLGVEIFEIWELPSKSMGRFKNSNDAKTKAVAFIHAKQELSVSKDRTIGYDEDMGSLYSRSRG